MSTQLLYGLTNTIKPPYKKYRNIQDRGLAWKLKTYGIKEPTIKQDNSIFLSIIYIIVSSVDPYTDPKIIHISDLVQLVIYFCLRPRNQKSYTVNLQTFQFWPLLDFVLFVLN